MSKLSQRELNQLMAEFKQAFKIAQQFPKQSNETLLMLYGLYMQATKGDISGKKPSFFNFPERAKYRSWKLLKGKPREIAMQGYINLVNHMTKSKR